MKLKVFSLSLICTFPIKFLKCLEASILRLKLWYVIIILPPNTSSKSWPSQWGFTTANCPSDRCGIEETLLQPLLSPLAISASAATSRSRTRRDGFFLKSSRKKTPNPWEIWWKISLFQNPFCGILRFLTWHRSKARLEAHIFLFTQDWSNDDSWPTLCFVVLVVPTRGP